jgi:DNA-directed RNA polymerase specialized sigma24 family protein
MESVMTNIVLLELLPALCGFARWLTGNREAGDALARDTLVKAWQVRATYVPGSNLKTWLFCILRNQFRSNYCRTPWEQKAAPRIPDQGTFSWN